MSLRRRLVLVAAGTVGVTVVLASIACFVVVRDNLRDEVDGSLLRSVERVRERPELGARPGLPPDARHPPFGGRRPPPRGEPENPVQLVRPDGTVLSPDDVQPLPVTATDRRLAAAGGDERRFEDRTIDGDRVRVLTAASPAGALVAGRSLEGVDSTLSRLRLVLVLLCAGAVAVAVALTRAYADRLQASRDALAASVAAQRQLVADASHELRTPVTSLRTNVEVLLEEGGASLGDDERRRLLEDMRGQSEELTLLINDVIELARGDQPLAAEDDVRLDEVVEEAVARARRDAPAVRFEARLAPMVVRGDAERLGRAVGNLLDNAAKHSPPGGVVEVTAGGGAVAVRDHGPGVPDADKPLIFDRFYRGATARGRPGSGLGLAIVRQVAAAHGGSVTVADAPGGGALFSLRLPAEGAA
ncbi:MAG TPA: HAMP domain-containing sensor histidine kinase [Solirubrobacteraceae bacterium]|nr:HAMP domain-containing sensor histidine kinase [Solirubrobacteraceae bacterium]